MHPCVDVVWAGRRAQRRADGEALRRHGVASRGGRREIGRPGIAATDAEEKGMSVRIRSLLAAFLLTAACAAESNGGPVEQARAPGPASAAATMVVPADRW